MAALAKVAVYSARLTSKNPAVLYNIVRNAGHWNKDFKPAPFPVTEAERKKAAEKYGMHPATYEPYPDDGMGYGDYPKLPLVSGDARDPFYPWDMPALKRNFNEPIHALEELINDTRTDPTTRFRYKKWQYFASFFGVMGAFIGVYLFLEDPTYKMHPPVLAKQFAREGKHYEFPGHKKLADQHHH